MSVIITINGTDKSSEIDWRTLQVNRAITNQVDTMNFEVLRANSSGYKPAMLDVVKVEQDGQLIFGGQIVQMQEKVNGLVEYVSCTASDFAFDMDRILVVQVYENMTVNDIIADINTNYLTGYDITNVNCTVVVKYIAFNYEMPSKCLQQLAQLVGYDWYVDDSKNIFFFLQGSSTAPFSLTDTNGKYIYKSLSLRNDIKNIRNSIIVRGGTYEGNTITEDLEADGDQITFVQAYKYSNLTVDVNGVSKTIGIDFIDDPADFDVLYNFNEKAVKFRDDNKPTAGQIVTFTGNPHIPVVTKVTNATSIAEFGEFQYKIVDKSIGSKDGARDRARAEIAQWAQELNEGDFRTYETGLDVGQKINIQSTIRGLDQNYIISRMSSKMDTPDRFVHTCTLVSSQTYGMVEFLQKLLIAKDKEIVISQDEVLDSIIGFNDVMRFNDTVEALAPTSGPYKWQPDASDARWNFATWS